MRIIAMLLFSVAARPAVPPSPRIESLRAAIQLRQTDAVAAFWTEITGNGGTPMIECPASLKPDCLVTFLWRSDGSTKNVVVRAEALPGAPADHLLFHLLESDVWYRTYRFRDDARIMYLLSINDPLTPWEVEGPERKQRYAGVRTDPLNPRNACYVSLPRAPSERWSEKRPGAPQGEIKRHRLVSAALSDDRAVDVYATPGFHPGPGVTPVLILFDGEESRDLGRTPIILDNLFSERRLPPMLAVYLLQPYERREADLDCNPATGTFLVDELLPWLRKEYGIHTSAGRTVVAGASLGGLAAAYAALLHPDVIGRVLSQSGAFWWGKSDSEREWLTAEFRCTRSAASLIEGRNGPAPSLCSVGVITRLLKASRPSRRNVDLLRRRGGIISFARDRDIHLG